MLRRDVRILEPSPGMSILTYITMNIIEILINPRRLNHEKLYG